MPKVLYCRDVGFDCDAVVRAATEAEILQQAAAHAQTEHGMQDMTDDVVAQVRSVIRDE